MSLVVHELSLQLVEELAPVVVLIARHDRDLARQIRRSATSIVLNIAEGQHSDPGTARARFHSAAGSANETRSALRIATCWRYLEDGQIAASLRQLDRIVAMLWRLTHGPKPRRAG